MHARFALNARNLLRLVLASSACVLAMYARPAGAIGAGAYGGQPHVEGTALVSIAAHVDEGTLAEELGSTGIEGISPVSVRIIGEGLAEVTFSDDVPLADAIRELERCEAVEEAQPDFLYTIQEQASLADALLDPLLPSQWGIESINAPAAWDIAYAPGAYDRVSIAVMDAGFDVDHEDLSSNVVPGSAFNAYRASKEETDEDLLADVSVGPALRDHGNHVAGICCAAGKNGLGVVGVAHRASIVPIRVYNYGESGASGATTSALVCAYDYVMRRCDELNIRVVNLSIGARSSNFSADDVLLSKIDEAFGRGIVTVGSAGNDARTGPYDNYPSDYGTVVSVMNLSSDASLSLAGTLSFDDAHSVHRASSSNYNATGERDKDLCAPGTNVLSTTDVPSSYGFGRYGYQSGTSMAAPHVSGTLALMFAVDPSMTAEEAVSALLSSARDVGPLGWDEQYGYGEVDAYAAVLEATSMLDLGRDGWQELPGDGKGYAKDGSLLTGWQDMGGRKLNFGVGGRMLVGWHTIGGRRFFFRPSGSMATGWATVDGLTLYFRPSGSMATGWATIEDAGVEKKYYFEEDGTLVRGCWRDIDNGQGVTNHYYFRPSGAMATGWATIGGQKYFFRPSGNMATGFADVPDDAFKRYFDEDGTMATGWREIEGKSYYFRPSGAMQTGSATIDGRAYTFSGEGVLVG